MPFLTQKQEQRQQESSANLIRLRAMSPAADQEKHPLLDLQHTIGNQAVMRSLQTPVNVHGLIPPVQDWIHEPLLERYSQETGVPRDEVTQHDPEYEAWVSGRPNITLFMPVPNVIPPPDYSRDETRLGAWERANLLLSVRQSFACDHVVNNNIESSFVTDVEISFTQSDFEYFIARHIDENMNNPALSRGDRITWKRIDNRIRIHAQEHFRRYRQVVAWMRQTIMQQLTALPNRNNPIQIPQRDLEAYLSNLLPYLVAQLRFELWETTCDWEKTDYPRLLQGIPNVQGRFVPACDPRPVVPRQPILPLVVTPGASRRRKRP